VQRESQADFLFGEAKRRVERARRGVGRSGVQREVDKAVVPRPVRRRPDQRPADAGPGGVRGHRKLADVAVWLAGEMPAPPDADHAEDRAPDGGHKHRAVPRLGGGQRVFQPQAPRRERFRLIPPGRDAFGQPRSEREDPGPVAARRCPDHDSVVHLMSIAGEAPWIKDAGVCGYAGTPPPVYPGRRRVARGHQGITLCDATRRPAAFAGTLAARWTITRPAGSEPPIRYCNANVGVPPPQLHAVTHRPRIVAVPVRPAREARFHGIYRRGAWYANRQL
jgi:hypothetical protein